MTGPIPRGVTARRFVRALERDGFHRQRTRGSHRIYRHSDGRRVVVAYHRLGDTFPIKTLSGMITDARWEYEDMRRLDLVR
ncbi:MAG: addiction module toxin, HicA family [Dehalococcoidia bacterium]|nr:addiction module toxin, HicA family [Dehalococcoidia bacterium]MYA61807.1 addiction module toxin, HicA family [Dehalococcoidia bacterium]